MEDPPVQDSPHHILNSLNDFCIQEILCRLDTIDDFINASKTCVRFHENAKACYPLALKDVILSNKIRGNYMETFLRDCGHFIQKIRWTGSDDLAMNGTAFGIIGRYCGRTLKSIDLKNYISTRSNVVQFTALQELKSDHSCIKDFDFLPKLRYLHISYQQNLPISQVLPFRRYPNLNGLTLEHINTLTNYNLTKFLACNRQLTKLYVKFNHQLTPSIFQYIAKYTPNIVILSIISDFRKGVKLSRDDLMQLGNLKKLKCLITAGFMYVSLCEMINTLASNNIPIETLFVQLASSVDHTSDNMQTLYQLRTIRIHGTVSDELILNLIRSQIALQEVHIVSPNSLTMQTIENAFLTGKNLLILSFCCFTEHFNNNNNQNVLVLQNSRIVEINKSVSQSGRIIMFTFKSRVDTA